MVNAPNRPLKKWMSLESLQSTEIVGATRHRG